MKLTLHKKKNIHAKKKLHLELDPRRYWVFLLSFFILALAAELAYFSWIFLETTRRVDAPSIPVLETNARQIRVMNTALDDIEAALEARAGSTEEEEVVEE